MASPSSRRCKPQLAAKMLVELSKSQDSAAGVIAGALLNHAASLLSHGIHPTVISEALHKLSIKAVDVLTAMAIPVVLSDHDVLIGDDGDIDGVAFMTFGCGFFSSLSSGMSIATWRTNSGYPLSLPSLAKAATSGVSAAAVASATGGAGSDPGARLARQTGQVVWEVC